MTARLRNFLAFMAFTTLSIRPLCSAIRSPICYLFDVLQTVAGTRKVHLTSLAVGADSDVTRAEPGMSGSLLLPASLHH